jgi:branched-chain amino acid transport system substrate-binding protein
MMHNAFRAARLVGAVAAVALGAGLTAAGAQEAVKIGQFTPLSGASSVVGVDMQRGVELAINRVNEGYEVPLKDGSTRMIGPGLLGAPVNLIVEDDESRPQSAMDAVRKLVEVDQVSVVLGEYSSGRTLPTGQFTNESGVPHISIGANAETLREIGPYFFNAIGLSGQQGPQLVKMAQDLAGAKTIGTFQPNNPYGVGLEIAVCEAAVAAGLECVSSVRYEEQKTDYRPELQQLMAPNPDAVIFFAYGADATLILRQAFEMDLPLADKWLAAEMSNWTADVADIPQVAEGIRGIEHSVSGEFYESQYRAAYAEAYGEEPLTAFGAFAYDAALLAALAVEEAGSTERDAIRDALPVVAETYKGITGDLAFDEDGMRKSQEYGTFIFSNNAMVPYTP